MHLYLFTFLCFFCVNSLYLLSSNPFVVDFPDLAQPSYADYESLQAKLRQIPIDRILEDYYDFDEPLAETNLYRFRMAQGTRQVLIELSKNLVPIIKLEKIGRGGDCCFVSYASYNGIYPELLLSIKDALEEKGFNGYFYYRIGGFPHPTGRELKYAGVPYCFKPFMMIEAYHLGFQKVIWIDASLLPVQNPEPLFKWLTTHSGLFYGGERQVDLLSSLILPQARKALEKIINKQDKLGPHVCAMLFGLNFQTRQAQKFLDTYYECVAAGTPFLSCFPEEFVFSWIGNGQGLSPGCFPPQWSLVRNEGKGSVFEAHEKQRTKEGVFFLYRGH